MGNCLSKFNGKPFTLHTSSLTSGHLKKVANGTQKNPVKYFTMGAHQKCGCERFSRFLQSIKSSLIDIYDRFPPQSCYMGFVKITDIPNSSIHIKMTTCIRVHPKSMIIQFCPKIFFPLSEKYKIKNLRIHQNWGWHNKYNTNRRRMVCVCASY